MGKKTEQPADIIEGLHARMTSRRWATPYKVNRFLKDYRAHIAEVRGEYEFSCRCSDLRDDPGWLIVGRAEGAEWIASCGDSPLDALLNLLGPIAKAVYLEESAEIMEGLSQTKRAAN